MSRVRLEQDQPKVAPSVARFGLDGAAGCRVAILCAERRAEEEACLTRTASKNEITLAL